MKKVKFTHRRWLRYKKQLRRDWVKYYSPLLWYNGGMKKDSASQPEQTKNLGGRPPLVTKEQVIEALELMAYEGIPLKDACEGKLKINYASVNRMIYNVPELSELDTRARKQYLSVKVRQMDEIARDPSLDTDTKKLLIDNIKWEASRVARHIYSEKAIQELTGKDGGAIEHKDVTAQDLAKKLTREELEQYLLLAQKVSNNDT